MMIGHVKWVTVNLASSKCPVERSWGNLWKPMSFSYIYVGMLFTSCKQKWQIQHVRVVGCKDHMCTNMKWKNNWWLSVKDLPRDWGPIGTSELDLKCLSDHKTPKTCHSTLVQKDRGMHRFKCHVNPGLIKSPPSPKVQKIFHRFFSDQSSIDIIVKCFPLCFLSWFLEVSAHEVVEFKP